MKAELITVVETNSFIAKNDRANLTQAETNMLGNAAKMLARKYGE